MGSVVLRRSRERAAVLPVVAVTIAALLLLAFFASQMAVNAVVNLRLHRTSVMMLQQMQGSFSDSDALRMGALVARLNGLDQTRALSATQNLPSGVSVDMDFNSAARPPVAGVELRKTEGLFDGMFRALGQQQHVVRLSATSEDIPVITFMDASQSMKGTIDGTELDELITAAGGRLDPRRAFENIGGFLQRSSGADVFSPIDSSAGLTSSRLYNATRLRLSLPFARPGWRSSPMSPPDPASFTKVLQMLNFPRTSGLYSFYYGQDPSGWDANQRNFTLGCDSDGLRLGASGLGTPGFRTHLPPTPDFGGEPAQLSIGDLCVAPWGPLRMTGDDHETGHFTQYEWDRCIALSGPGGSQPIVEIGGPGCMTQWGALVYSGFTDFTRTYKEYSQRFLLDLDRFARQTIGVFSGSTPVGRVAVNGSPIPGAAVLWDSSQPDYRDARLYQRGINLNPLWSTGVGGVQVPLFVTGWNYAPYVTRDLLMRAMTPRSDPRLVPGMIQVSGSVNGSRVPSLAAADPAAYAVYRKLLPVEDPAFPYPLPYGGYNSYAIWNPLYQPSSLLNSGYAYNWGTNMSPNPGGLNQYDSLPPTVGQIDTPLPPLALFNQGWNYTIPDLRDLDPATGLQTGGAADRRPTNDYALAVWNDLMLSSGGTDTVAAIEKMALAIRNHTGDRAVAVLMTDGAPTRPCSNPAAVGQFFAGLGITASVACAGNTELATQIAEINTALRAAEQEKATLFIVLLMVPRNAENNPDIQQFMNNVVYNYPATDDDSVRWGMVLNHTDLASFRENLRFALATISLAVRSYAVYRP